MRQASRRVVGVPAIEKLGKQGRDENGKYPVNEDAEESFARFRNRADASERAWTHAGMNWPTYEG